ncbi:MAG: glycosyltransferase [Candidatus Eisenbacteria bacterium]|uniref:Glycosyltransferase n=1 Tax=Eiseniibacteriota bacterium TaxID=2212470 RepID=A0A9D6L690_UNCEI|nr:glycosyltransferase [Candidatus Eisenbacteria bacterium]
MRIGVVVSCYRQERFLARTVAAIERALAGREWNGVLELAVLGGEPLPALSERWRVVSAFDPVTGRPGRPLTPGAGRMLGFAACGGDWVLFVDSDVEVDADWMDAAIATAASGPSPAGVFGRIEEWFVDGTREWRNRDDMYATGDRDTDVGYFAALAFYRRDALQAVGGYDTRLHSDEDFELGLRLRARGFVLRSLGRLAARHWSPPRPNVAELGRRWRTGICFGQGEVLRLYAGRRGFGALLWRQRFFLAAIALWSLGAVALAVSLVRQDLRPLAAWAATPLAVIALMAARKRSLRLGTLSLLTWTVQGAGLIVGLVRREDDRPARPAAEVRC